MGTPFLHWLQDVCGKRLASCKLRFGDTAQPFWIVSWSWTDQMMKLTATMQAEILQQAKDEFPRESCGLVAVVKGRRRYFPCRNIAETP